MKYLVMVAIAMSSWFYQGCVTMNDQIVHNQRWVIICEDDAGPYYLEYDAPERYDWIEEVHLCEG